MKPKTDYGLPAHIAGALALSFVPLDLNKDGFIDAEELRASITAALPPLLKDEATKEQLIRAILAQADLDDDGRVDFTEFSQFLETHRVEQAKTVSSLRHVAEENGLLEAVGVIAKQSPATLRTLFATFVSNGHSLRKSCPDAPPSLFDELASSSAEAIAQLLKTFETLKYGGLKRRASLMKRSGTIAQLNSEDSILRNPLSHLLESQLHHLARHLKQETSRPAEDAQRHYESAQDIMEVLRGLFDDEVRDALLEDAAEMLLTTYHAVDDSTLREFISSIHAYATNHVNNADKEESSAQVYTVSELQQNTQQLLASSLTNEEVDLLRDTFVRLDTDGDGFVSLFDCQRVAEDVLGPKFATFLPYLNALFGIADKDNDGCLSLSEFLLSFVEGPGVVPQEVITECVAAIKVRLVDAELLAIKAAFSNMDQNCDGALDFKELCHATELALRSHAPTMTSDDVRDLVDALLSKADRDLDGKLNMSEFIRSVQEDQGVVPVQLIEYFAAVLPTPLPPQREPDAAAAAAVAHPAEPVSAAPKPTEVTRPSSALGTRAAAAPSSARSSAAAPTVGTFNERAVKAFFHKCDHNADGLIVVGDVGMAIVKLLEKRHPMWAPENYLVVTESLIANADRDGNGFLSLHDFIESFRSGYPLLPEGFSEDMGRDIALALDDTQRASAASVITATAGEKEWKRSLRSAFAQASDDDLVFLEDYFAPVEKDRSVVYDLLHLPKPGVTVAKPVTRIAATAAAATDEKKGSLPPTTESKPSGPASSPNKGAAPSTSAPPVTEAIAKPKEPSHEQGPAVKRPLVVVGPQELHEAKKIIRSLAQAHDELAVDDFKSKLCTALTDLMFGDPNVAQQMVVSLVDKCTSFVKAQPNSDRLLLQMDCFGGMLLGDDVPAEELGWTVPNDQERLAAASSLLMELLPSYHSRSALAEALLRADPFRTGELNISVLRAALVSAVPLAAEKRSQVLRAIRNTGIKNVMGLYSVSVFVEKFTFANFVTPSNAYPAYALLRWFTHHERCLLNEILSTFDYEFEDTGAPPETKVAQLQRALGKEIARHPELPLIAPTENLHTASRLVAELVVFGNRPLSEVRKDPSALSFPWTLLPAPLRCDHAIRLLRARIGEAPQLRRLLRCLLFADRNLNGIVPKLVLTETLSTEIRQLQPTWSGAKVQLVTEEFLLANEVDDKGFVLLSKMIDNMTSQLSMVTPTQAATVFVAAPLSDPAALSAALYHLCEKPSVSIQTLRDVTDGGNSRTSVASITKFFEDSCGVNDVEEIDIRQLFKVCTFHTKGLVAQLSGLDEKLAQRCLFAVLPVERQRFFASCFAMLDLKKDNVLDWDELQPCLLRYATNRHEVDPLESATKLFHQIDVLQMGLITVEEFLAALAGGLLPVDAFVESATRPSTTPATFVSRSQQSSQLDKATTPNKTKLSKLKQEGLADDDLQEQFNAFDVNKNGYLDCNEFAVLYQKMEHYGLTPSLPEIRRLFRSICVNPSMMTFDEFCVLMLRKSRM